MEIVRGFYFEEYRYENRVFTGFLFPLSEGASFKRSLNFKQYEI